MPVLERDMFEDAEQDMKELLGTLRIWASVKVVALSDIEAPPLRRKEAPSTPTPSGSAADVENAALSDLLESQVLLLLIAVFFASIDMALLTSSLLCLNCIFDVVQDDRIRGSDFERLGPMEQASVANELMRSVSSSATACIMTTLPPPPAVATTGHVAERESNRSRASSRTSRRRESDAMRAAMPGLTPRRSASINSSSSSTAGSAKHFSEYRGTANEPRLVDDAMKLAKSALMDGCIDPPSDPTEYFNVIERFSRDLPPVLMVHGVSVTVTTQL